jgi:hypothetical protein
MLGKIDRPLRSVELDDGALRFELPNWQPWAFAGVPAANGTLVGALTSSQGGVSVTFIRETPGSAGHEEF